MRGGDRTKFIDRMNVSVENEILNRMFSKRIFIK